MTRIICLGTAVIDRVFAVDAIPSTPIKVQASDYRERCGGVAATAAVAVAALGHEAVYWGRLGDDAIAARLIEVLKQNKVDASAVRRIPGGKSPTAAVIVDRNGERLLAAFRGGGLGDDPSWLPLHELDRADALLVDTRWLDGTVAALDAARARGVPTVLDADLGEPSILAALCAKAEHTIFAAIGLKRLTGHDDPEAGLRAAQKETGGIVGVTMGARGAYWLEAGMLRHQPPFKIVARDTTGAGDTFHGAYALAIAQKKPIAEAMRFAAAAAAIKAQRGEGWDGMPDPKSVEQLMRGEQS
jgi:sulfofructose kinase